MLVMDVKTRREEREQTDKGDAQDRQAPKAMPPVPYFFQPGSSFHHFEIIPQIISPSMDRFRDYIIGLIIQLPLEDQSHPLGIKPSAHELFLGYFIPKSLKVAKSSSSGTCQSRVYLSDRLKMLSAERTMEFGKEPSSAGGQLSVVTVM